MTDSTATTPLIDLVPGYKAYLIAHQRGPGGQHDYLCTIRQLCRFCAPSTTAADLDLPTLQGFVATFHHRSIGRQYTIASTLRDFGRWCVLVGLRVDNPALQLPPPPKPDAPRPVRNAAPVLTAATARTHAPAAYMPVPAPLGPPAADTPLWHLIPAYERYLVGEQRRPAGRYTYMKTVRRILRTFPPEATHADLTDRAVRRYKEQLAAQGVSKSEMINTLAVIRDFCLFARLEGWRTDDPTALVRRPSKERPNPHPLYAGDLAALLQALAVPDDLDPTAEWYWRRNRLVVLLLVYSGVRRTEATNLRWGHINLAAGRLEVWNGKNGKDRVIPLHPTLRVELEAVPLATRSDPQQPVIAQRTGAPLTPRSFEHIFEEWLARRGFTIHPHQLRHTFASHLLWNDVDLTTIQKLLGHAQLSTTEYYVRIDTRRATRMLNRLPDFMTPPEDDDDDDE